MYYMQCGWSPLHYAAEKNSKECLEILLSHGAEVNMKNNVSNYYIMICVLHSHKALIFCGILHNYNKLGVGWMDSSSSCCWDKELRMFRNITVL